MQTKGHCVAHADLRGRAKNLAIGVGGDRVAAFEYAQGAAFLELEAQTVEALAFVAKGAIGAGGEFEAKSFKAKTDRGDSHPKIEGDDAFVGDVEALGAEGEIGAERVSEARGHFVGTLALLAKQVERAAKSATCAEFVDATA